MVLAAIYFVTMLFTELMSNNAAAVLIFPIAWQTAADMGVEPMPFVMAITVAASCGFATPIMINNDFVESVTPESVARILSELK
jgi:di/tricarboxylate transporter